MPGGTSSSSSNNNNNNGKIKNIAADNVNSNLYNSISSGESGKKGSTPPEYGIKAYRNENDKYLPTYHSKPCFWVA